MLQFEQLVSAIQSSVLSAAEALTAKNLELFKEFFEEGPEPEDISALLENAIREASNVSADEDARELARRLSDSLGNLAEALKTNRKALQPKLVAIDYPMVTSEGPKIHTVLVPLISIAPVTTPRITKLVFHADLEIQVDDDDRLLVAFGKKQRASSPENDEAIDALDREEIRATASIEIVIEGDVPPDGFRKVIEGYEKALRAQIPG